MKRRFKRGTFKLQEEVTDLVTFEEPIRPKLQEIIDWADEHGVRLRFGTSKFDTYLCEYEVKAQTNGLCKGYVNELKTMLQELFPNIQRIMEWSGTCW